MLLNFNTVFRIIHVCVRQQHPSLPAAVGAQGVGAEGPTGSAAPRSPGMKCMTSSPQSHPQLPLLVEIGIKPCLGVVLVDISKSGLTNGSCQPHQHPGPTQATDSSAQNSCICNRLSRSPTALKTVSSRCVLRGFTTIASS